MGIAAESHGVQVTLIDFTLSRLCTADGAGAYCDLEADPELFQGPKGDCQVRMQTSNVSCMSGFHTVTHQDGRILCHPSRSCSRGPRATARCACSCTVRALHPALGPSTAPNTVLSIIAMLG